jgi:photosystem II oxygen-evolving enhancer protein 2
VSECTLVDLVGCAPKRAVLSRTRAAAIKTHSINAMRMGAGFIPYTGDGFAVLLPSKWNPSKEKDFKGVVLRYEDNADTVNNFVVIKLPTGKSSMDSYGSPDAFLTEMQNFGLFGKQPYVGATMVPG